MELKTVFDQKLQEKLDAYARAFRVEDLNDANDKTTLLILLRTELMIEDLQVQIQQLMLDGAAENAGDIKKLADLLRDATTSITNLQRVLAIDRKTRRDAETVSVADYIRTLKINAAEFLKERIVMVYCPDCKVLVGRVYPVHEHTAYVAGFACSQCDNVIKVEREEKDVFFDIVDHEWRRKYRVEIIQPTKGPQIIEYDEEDDMIIEGDAPLEDITL